MLKSRTSDSGVASASSRGASGAGKYPSLLAQGVVLDILSKELDAHFNPADEAKNAALEAAKASLPGRVTLLTAQIAAANPSVTSSGFQDVLQAVWKLLRNHAHLERLTPSALQSSATIDTLTTIHDAGRSGHRQDIRDTGSLLVLLAILGLVDRDAPPFSEGAKAAIVPLIEWWGDEVCGRRWGIRQPWFTCRLTATGPHMGVLHMAASTGFDFLVPMAVRKGCCPNAGFKGACQGSPAIIALKSGHLHVIEALLAHGLDLVRPHNDGFPLAVEMFERGNGKAEFLRDLIRRRPEIIKACSTDYAVEARNVAGAAIISGDPALVELAISVGAPLDHEGRMRGQRMSLTAAAQAILLGSPDVLKVVIEKGKVFENWKAKYGDNALSYISTGLALLATTAYPTNPLYKGNPQHPLIQYNPRALECLDMVFATDFDWSWNVGAGNSLLENMYRRGAGGPGSDEWVCALEEKDALKILKRFHAAGFDVVHAARPASAGGSMTGAVFGLTQLSAYLGQNIILDWCIGEVGAPAESTESNSRAWAPLKRAIVGHNIPGVVQLLDKYKVKVALPDAQLQHQPGYALMHSLTKYSDSEAEKVMRALVERDPSLFDHPCYNAEAVVEAERSLDLTKEHTYIPWNPVARLAHHGKVQTLEYLLKKNLPGIAAMAHRPVTYVFSPGVSRRVTPCQLAITRHQWDAVGILLRYTDARVTDSYDDTASAAALVKAVYGRSYGPPRAFLATVDARAKKELAEARAAAKASASSASAAVAFATAAAASSPSTATITLAASAEAAQSNAFEDPSVKPLSEKEEKAKAKKKAAKKKAKAKKRAAAKAGAGGSAGGAAAGDSSDDDDDDDVGVAEEEPDDNLVDSSNAPSLDLMRAQMGLTYDDEASGDSSAAGAGSSSFK